MQRATDKMLTDDLVMQKPNPNTFETLTCEPTRNNEITDARNDLSVT